MNADSRSRSLSSMDLCIGFQTDDQEKAQAFISKRLEVAINTGQVGDAERLAQVLASTKIHITVSDLTGLESEVSIRVIIEHRDEICLTLKALPSSSIYALKTQLWQLYKFLPEEQRLIISNRLALNHELLSNFLTDSGRSLTVYVYIMSKTDSKAGKSCAS